MSTATYYKLRQENKELNENLALYENGFSDLVVEENVLKVPDSFKALMKEEPRASMDSIFWNAFSFSLGICTERVNFISDKKSEVVYMPPSAWEYLKKLGNGDPSDGPEWQEHIRNKERGDRIGDRFKDPDDPLKVVIVRDMWLTGFDVPSLHTMYIDKPMQGHTLMQAIARVNSVFRDKPGGLVVDYIGIGLEVVIAG